MTLNRSLMQMWAYAFLGMYGFRLLNDAVMFPDSLRRTSTNRVPASGRVFYNETEMAAVFAHGVGWKRGMVLSDGWEYPWTSIDHLLGESPTHTRQRRYMYSLHDALYLGDRVSVQHYYGSPRRVPVDPPYPAFAVDQIPPLDVHTLWCGLEAAGYMTWEEDYDEFVHTCLMYDWSVFRYQAPPIIEPARASHARPVEEEPPYTRVFSSPSDWYEPVLPRFSYYDYDSEDGGVIERVAEGSDLSEEDGIPDRAQAVHFYSLSFLSLHLSL